MMNPGMKPGAMGMGGRGLPGASAGPKMSTIPMSMPMSGSLGGGSPAFQPGGGYSGGGQGAAGSMGAGRAAGMQTYMRDANAQHRQAQQASLDSTRAKAGQLGLPGGSQAGSGPRGSGIVPAGGMMPGGGAFRMSMPAGGGLTSILSDAESKKKIRELEGVNEQYRALLGGPASTEGALDSAYREPSTSEYEYKDPSAPGAAPGRQVGPMAQELEGIPGVVAPGPDGMKRVDPQRLTMANTSQLAQQRRELDALKAHLDALGTPDAKLSYAATGR